MIIRHDIAKSVRGSYTKVDRYVFTNRKLSDGAKVLYGYLAGLKSGSNFSDTYILKALGISKAVLYRRKKELTETDLILMEKLDLRTYAIYVGWTKVPASQVKQEWIADEDIGEKYNG